MYLEAVTEIYKYMEDHYPLIDGRKRKLRITSAKRWALATLADRILDHPLETPIDILNDLMKELLFMVSRLSDRGVSLQVAEPYLKAIDALIDLDKYFEETYK